MPSLSVGSDVCLLGLLGVNCTSIEAKWDQFGAYMVLHDPSLVCLQDLSVAVDPTKLVGLLYRLLSGDAFLGGGEAVLVHVRWTD